MSFKVFQSKYNPNAYLVLAADHSEPGECLISFTGEHARELAEEYAVWKNTRAHAETPPPTIQRAPVVDATRRTWKATLRN
jgi:hypothetical protein